MDVFHTPEYLLHSLLQLYAVFLDTSQGDSMEITRETIRRHINYFKWKSQGCSCEVHVQSEMIGIQLFCCELCFVAVVG